MCVCVAVDFLIATDKTGAPVCLPGPSKVPRRTCRVRLRGPPGGAADPGREGPPAPPRRRDGAAAAGRRRRRRLGRRLPLPPGAGGPARRGGPQLLPVARLRAGRDRPALRRVLPEAGPAGSRGDGRRAASHQQLAKMTCFFFKICLHLGQTLTVIIKMEIQNV